MMRLARIGLMFVAGLVAIAATAGPIQLVKDINRTLNTDYLPSKPVQLGSELIGSLCRDGIGVCELWATDGASARRVKDIPNFGGGILVRIPTRVADKVYFFAYTADVDHLLWVTDGTEDGTHAVPTTVQPNSFRQPAAIGSVLVFVSQDGALWRTDGTEAGTFKLKDTAFAVMATSNAVYVIGVPDPGSGSELWKTDGTVAGTVMVADLNPGAGSASPGLAAAFDDKLYFEADDGTGVRKIFVTDGTSIEAIAPFGLGSLPGIARLGAYVYFSHQVDDSNAEIWRTDGTAAGTTQVGSWPVSLDSGAAPLTAAGSFIYFGVTENSSPLVRALWETDGTLAGTGRVPGVATSGVIGVSQFLVAGDTLYFYGPGGYQRTRGDAASSEAVTPITYSSGVAPMSWGAIGNTAFFTGDPGPTLWKTDGVAGDAGRFLVPAGQPSTGSNWCGDGVVAMDSLALFLASDTVHGCQLWKSDGSDAGTSIVHDLSPGSPLASTGKASIGVAGNYAYFIGSDNTQVINVTQLWRTDGTDAGTTAIKTFGSVTLQDIVSVGSDIYFSIYGGSDTGLWKSDGTSAGTTHLLQADVRELSAMGGQVFFRTGLPAPAVWRTDGTPAGTVQLLPFAGNMLGPFRPALTQIFFVLTDSPTGTRIWRSDGTPAGTRMAWDQEAGMITGTLGDIAIFSGLQAGDYGLWKTDGTAAGTQKLVSQLPGQSQGEVLGGRLYFGSGNDLWRTDGTPVGTLVVANNILVCCLKAAGGSLFFLGQDSLYGAELRMSAGSPGPVTLVEDFVPGPGSMGFASSVGFAPVALPTGLFFRASGRGEGNEPYFLPFDTTPDPISFATKIGIAGVPVVSDPAQITGINAATVANVTNGQVCVSSSANCACDVQPYGSSPPVGLNQYICVRHTASATVGGTVTSTLSVGGVPSSFTSTTGFDVSVVQFTPAAYNVTEGQPSVTVSVSRTGSPALTASVAWSITSGTALAGVDYSGPTSGVINWAVGDSAAKSIVIPIIDDALPEPAKQFTLTLSSPVNMIVGANVAAQVNLVDNDSGFLFVQPSYTVAESAGSVTIPVQRLGATARAGVSVHWTAVNGTATAGADFGTKGSATQPSGVLNWAGTDFAAKNIVIPILQDAFSEGPETFTVVLSGPSVGMALGNPSSAIVTITDDDLPAQAVVSFTQSKIFVTESISGAGANFILHLTPIAGPPTIPISVTYSTQPGTALATSDYYSSTATVTWAPGDLLDKLSNINIANDNVAEGPESFKIVIAPASPGVQIGQGEVTVTIIDDDEVFPKYGAVPSDWTVPAAADAGWHVSNEPGAYEGVFSLRSDQIADGQVAQVEVTRNFAAGNVTFRVKISSEPVFDELRFFVDGIEKGTWSGTATTGWTLFSTPVTAGTHTLRWSYEKDGAVSVGSDAAWIDAVTLP